MELVSINIVNWNGLPFLSGCIDSIKSQTYKNIEINIIDNCSSDDSCNFLSDKYPEIRLLRNCKNEGFSRAHNQGIDISSGEYILPLNFDILLSPDFVEKMVKAVKSYKNVGIASGKLYILNNGEKTNIIDSTGISMLGMFPADRGHNEFDCRRYDMLSPYIFGASGAAGLLCREMLYDIKIGKEFFDEDFYIYVEDVDLCWRAQLYGWKAVYTSEAVAYHYRGATREKNHNLKREYFIMGYRNRYWAIIKNAAVLSFLKNILWIFIRELGFYLHNILCKNYFVFTVPTMVLKKLPKMLKKRSIIQKKRGVSLRYMDQFFFSNLNKT